MSNVASEAGVLGAVSENESEVKKVASENAKHMTAEERFVPLSLVKEITGEDFPEQRSHAWFALRKQHNQSRGMSSSQFASLFFIDDEDDFYKRYSVIFEGKKDPPDERGKRCMAWGVKHEQTALLAWLKKHPHAIVTDAPFTLGSSGIAASPDGFYIEGNRERMGVIEIKCPYGKAKSDDASHPPHTKLVYYYLPQMHAHMHVSGESTNIFPPLRHRTVRNCSFCDKSKPIALRKRSRLFHICNLFMSFTLTRTSFVLRLFGELIRHGQLRLHFVGRVQRKTSRAKLENYVRFTFLSIDAQY